MGNRKFSAICWSNLSVDMSQQEAINEQTIFWNVWVMLALPTAWLAWYAQHLLLYEGLTP